MSTQIRLLGKPIIEVDEQPSPIQNSAKGLALLAYLIVTRQAHSREVIADLLWDADSTAKGFGNLRQLLLRVRKWLPDLQISATEVAYAATGFVDLYGVLAGLTAVEPHTRDEALQMYTGDLLADFYLPDAPRFNEWLLLEREQLRQRVVVAYQQLCETYAEQEDWVRGVAAAQHWLQLDELDESALQYLLQFLAATGQIELALQQYEISKERLWVELEVEPEPETEELVQRLRQLKAKQGSGLSWDVIVGAQVERPSPNELAEPGNLPPNAVVPYQRNPDFTGRSETLIHLAQRLLPQAEETTERAVAVTGMGGLGKTQIAVEFCYRYGRYFPGGVFWLNLANEENITAEVVSLGGERGLGLYRDADGLTQADKVARVRKAWQAPIPRLLVYDNCEDEALLVEWLPVTGGCSVLVTSRRGVWSSELGIKTIPLLYLERWESTQMLQKLVTGIEALIADEIAAETGDLPLALYLAGSFLRRYRQVLPAQYLHQLRNQGLLTHPSLQGRGTTLSPTSHELSVADTFAVSWGQLNPDNEVDALARQLQARAAHFAPGEPLSRKVLLTTVRTSTDILQQLLVEDGLTRLLDLGLMKAEGPETVIVHRLLADFSLEATRDDQSAQATVEKAVLTALVNPEKKTLTPLNQLPLSFGHLRHVTDAAIVRNSQLAARIGIAFAQYLYLMADYAAAQKYLETILSQKAIHKDTDEQIQIFLLLSDVLGSQSLYQQALQAGEQAEMFCREEESLDRIKLSKILSSKSWILIWLGQAEAARIAAEEALVHATASKEPSVIVSCLNLTAVIHYYILEQFESGQKYLEDALALFKTEAVVQDDRSAILTNLGNCLVAQGKPAEAIPYIQQALAMTQESGHRTRKLNQRTNLMGAWVALGAYETAVNGLLELITQAPPGWRVLSEAYCFLGNAYLGLGQHEAALAAGQNGLAVAMETENAREVAHAWLILGRAAGLTDQPVSVSPSEANLVDAATCFDKSLAQFVDLGLKRDQALVLWHWASYEIASGKRDAGQARRKAAREILIALRLPALLATMEKQIEGFG